jgi:hypothetical protein
MRKKPFKKKGGWSDSGGSNPSTSKKEKAK